jgi:hypothetical protein
MMKLQNPRANTRGIFVGGSLYFYFRAIFPDMIQRPRPIAAKINHAPEVNSALLDDISMGA